MRLLVLFAILTAVCQSNGQRCVRNVQEIGAFKANQRKPINYETAIAACSYRNHYSILGNFEKLNAEERALCGDQLVPLAVFDDEENEASSKVPAVNLMTGQRQEVSSSFKFGCVLCQHFPISFPEEPFYSFDGSTQSARFIVHLTRSDTNMEATVTTEMEKELSQELHDLLKIETKRGVKFHRSWLDETQKLNFEFWISMPISNSVKLGEETSIFNGNFVMRVEDVNTCPEGDTVDVDGIVTHWAKKDSITVSERSAIQFAINASTGSITGRQCSFRKKEYLSSWDPRLSRWELVWKSCSMEEQYKNEWNYLQFLNSSDVKRRHSEVLKVFTESPVDTTTLNEVTSLVERELQVHKEISEQTMTNLAAITAKLTMDLDYCSKRSELISLIVADLIGSEPVEGFTLQNEEFTDAGNYDITVNRKPTMKGQGTFALDVSGRLLEAHSRVTFVITKTKNSQFTLSQESDERFIEVTVMFPRPGEVSAEAFAKYANYHVDMSFSSSLSNSTVDAPSIKSTCLAWTNSIQEWTSQGCMMMYTDQDGFSACRCSGKYFFMQEGVPVAKFAVKK